MTDVQNRKVSIERAIAVASDLYKKKQPVQARQIIEQVIERRPEYANAHHLRGAIMLQLNELEEAGKSLQRAVELAPANASFRNSLGVWLKNSERLDEAWAEFERVKKLNPVFAPVYTNIGLLHQRLEDYEAAEAAHRHALELEAKYKPAWHNLGNTLDNQGRTEEALAAFDRALELAPNDAEMLLDRGLCRLRAGDYERGWADYEGRLRMIDQRLRHSVIKAPFWAGESFAGKTLVIYQEQGFGDVIQCLRYLPEVKALGGTVLFLAAEPLRRLLESIGGSDRIITAFEAVPAVDLKVPIFSLPRIFRTRWPEIPAPVPYIRAADDARLPDDGEGPRVGLAWAGSPTFKGDHRRTMPVEALAPILDVPGVRFYSLQFGFGGGAVDPRIRVLGDEVLGDFYQTAGIIEKLDLVVTVDTVTVHLAGALDRPAWLMLSHCGDWRWGRELETSPWYPSVRIFRQERPTDWGGVTERVAAALSQLVVGPA